MNSVDLERQNQEIASIKVRPPLLFVGALASGLVLDHLQPIPVGFPRLIEPFHKLISVIIIFAGLSFFVSGIGNFQRAATPVPSTLPVRQLVTTGIHGFSRNPIYLGMILIYAGIGIALRSYWVLILLIPVVVILRYAVIAREETYLARRFGQNYKDYKSRVRRWL